MPDTGRHNTYKEEENVDENDDGDDCGDDDD